jgi:hypothetical protein
MKNKVLKDIDALIFELKKTNNSTQKYFIDIRDELSELKSTDREKELLEILSKSSRIMDAGGFNLAQQNLWEKMYKSILDHLSSM